MTQLILASSSIYRRQLLERLTIPFECHSPEIDESPQSHETPQNLVKRLSREKACALTTSCNNHLIIGSDQVAELHGEIITKPGCHQQAKKQLYKQSSQRVLFHTGLCLLNSLSGHCDTDIITTEVVFRTLSEEEIERYLKKEKPYQCAGSFMCEGLGISLFKEINSQDPTALTGLPLIRLCDMLRDQGVTPFQLINAHL